MIRYIVPSVNSKVKLERHCPYCQRKNGSIHSGVSYRRISDIKVAAIPQQRMRCPFCGATWTVRAEGVGHGRHRSDRLIAIGVVLYMFGLSYRSVSKFLPLLDLKGSKSAIERDVAAAGQKAKALTHPYLSSYLRGADGVCDLRKVV